MTKHAALEMNHDIWNTLFVLNFILCGKIHSKIDAQLRSVLTEGKPSPINKFNLFFCCCLFWRNRLEPSTGSRTIFNLLLLLLHLKFRGACLLSRNRTDTIKKERTNHTQSAKWRLDRERSWTLVCFGELLLLLLLCRSFSLVFLIAQALKSHLFGI